MKPEDRFLFLSARQQLRPDHILRMQALALRANFDWERVFSTAERNAIVPLVYTHVASTPELLERVPVALVERFRLQTLRNSFYKQQRSANIAQVLHYFNQREISVILIKGAAQDLLVLDQPWYTVSIDVDMILRPRHGQLSPKELRALSDFLFQKRVEFDFFEHHDMTINGMLPVDFTSVWKEAVPVTCRGEPALVLCPEDHLISLCINSCRKRFFRLKALFDIHETVLKFAGLDWQKFSDRCRAFQCGNIVYAALLTAARTLETPVPSAVMRQLGVSTLRAALINFGASTLLRFWSLSENPKGMRIFKHAVDPSLLLAYLTYTPSQVRSKLKEISGAQTSARA